MDKQENKLKNYPLFEKPDERCINFGPGALSDAELLSVIIRTGTKDFSCIELSRKILSLSSTYNGLLNLYHLTYNELIQIKGIGKVKAVQLLCVAELSKRLIRAKKSEKPILNDSKKVAEYFMEEMRNLETEHFYAAFFDTKCHLIDYQVVFIGTSNYSIANPREVLRLGLKLDATNLIVLHNHPSGNPQPSVEDVTITNKLYEAANIVGIPLIDHIIIGDNTYLSFADTGLLNN